MDDALKVIKSLITTSSDGGLLVNEITKEYKEMVGKPVPFQEFGFKTLTDFLRSTNEFSGIKTANGIKVTVKIPGKSAHIIAMRQKQNVSAAEKKRRKRSMMKSGMGGAMPFTSQQPRRSIPSQVMKRHTGIISKPRTRVQPQRIAGSNSTIKPMQRFQIKSTSTAQISNNTNQPPVNNVKCSAVPSQKVNLHDRFVQKQLSEPPMPKQMAIPPPATSPVRFHCTTPPSSPPPSNEERPCKFQSKLMARLHSKQITPSENGQKSPNDSDTHTVVSKSSLSVGRLSRSQLLERLSPKQFIPSPVQSPVGRSALQKIIQRLEDEKSQSSSESVIPSNDERLQANRSDNISEHKQKPCEVVPTMGKTMTRRDLYARLAPKMTKPENDATHVGCNLNLNKINEKNDLSSRLRPKQVESESFELQQINQKVRKMCFLKVFWISIFLASVFYENK